MYTYYETTRDWSSCIYRLEKQSEYERAIVRSVPPMHIGVSTTELEMSDRCDPG